MSPKPALTLVVAMSPERVIGAKGRLPWHLPADLKHFRSLTMGKSILMGRRTHESIGRPLPGRHNIIISRDPTFRSPGCVVVASLEQALSQAQAAAEIMVIGGAMLYAASLPLASRIHLTEVHAAVVGDVYFPWELSPGWRETERCDHRADASNPYPYSFVVLERC